jgi:hypothetical protein
MMTRFLNSPVRNRRFQLIFFSALGSESFKIKARNSFYVKFSASVFRWLWTLLS